MFQRYKEFSIPLKTKDGTVYLSSLMFVEFEYTGEIKWHRVDIREAGRPDLIAYKWLDDPAYWPFIAWFNNIKDPLTGFDVIVQQKDDNGDLMFDELGNPIMIPNVLMIPVDKTLLIKGVVPRAYQQLVA